MKILFSILLGQKPDVGKRSRYANQWGSIHVTTCSIKRSFVKADSAFQLEFDIDSTINRLLYVRTGDILEASGLKVIKKYSTALL